MRLTSKAIIAGALALGASGVGSALASARSSPAHKGSAAATNAPSREATATDLDNIQFGDQTGPDTTAATARAASTSAAGDENNGQSDDPGGHTDTGSNVDHQFQGSE